MQNRPVIHAQEYRPDVDGLRTIAVVPVVLFHAGLFGVTGGFVGVDVFFVISGFLITNIILRDLEAGRFSILNFYERRARRILPALFAVLAATTVAAFALFMPRELDQFGHSAIATVLFVSNFYFFDTADYFATATEQQPLLHTWSLAVEEQFYIFHPLLLPLILRHSNRPIAIVAAVGAVSLAISVVLLEYNAVAAFYLAPSRVWELSVGSLLALGAVPRIRNRLLNEGLAVAGVAAIVLSAVLYTPQTPFPGLAALAPVLGGALVIHTGQHGDTMVSRLLSLPPMVGIGLISYSLYLWHWPLITFSEYYLMRPLGMSEGLVIVVASFALAHLSWRFVEMPFRRPNGVFGRPTLFAAAASVAAVFCAIGIATSASQGFPGRLPREVAAMLEVPIKESVKRTLPECQKARGGEFSPPNTCIIGVRGSSPPSFVLWGDSHAAAFAPTASTVAIGHGLTGVVSAKNGCPPIVGLKIYGKAANKGCDVYNKKVYEFIVEHNIRHVVLVARWAAYAEGTKYKQEGDELLPLSPLGVEQNAVVFSHLMAATIDALVSHGVEVLVVGPVPEVGVDVPSVLARAKVWGRVLPELVPKQEFVDRQKRAFDVLASVGKREGVEVVYPHDVLCNDVRCQVEIDGQPLYRDDDHLSRFGGTTISRLIDGTLRRWATSTAASVKPASIRAPGSSQP